MWIELHRMPLGQHQRAARRIDFESNGNGAEIGALEDTGVGPIRRVFGGA